MKALNEVKLIGNVGQDPEVRATPSGVSVAKLSIATTKSWKDKDSGQKKEDTQWHNVVVWRGLADVVGQYVHKGDRIYISGELRTRKWDDKQGVTHYTTEIIANDLIMLSAPKPEQTKPAQPAQQAAATPAGNDDWDDDIPF